jgi:hypothetical protein
MAVPAGLREMGGRAYSGARLLCHLPGCPEPAPMARTSATRSLRSFRRPGAMICCSRPAMQRIERLSARGRRAGSTTREADQDPEGRRDGPKIQERACVRGKILRRQVNVKWGCRIALRVSASANEQHHDNPRHKMPGGESPGIIQDHRFPPRLTCRGEMQASSLSGRLSAREVKDQTRGVELTP